MYQTSKDQAPPTRAEAARRGRHVAAAGGSCKTTVSYRRALELKLEQYAASGATDEQITQAKQSADHAVEYCANTWRAQERAYERMTPRPISTSKPRPRTAPRARAHRTSSSSRTSSTDPGSDSDGGDGPSPAARPTRLNIRDVHAEAVWKAMREHADEIADERDVLRLPALSDLPGERVAVAVADLVAQGRVVGGLGAGRVRAVQGPSA